MDQPGLVGLVQGVAGLAQEVDHAFRRQGTVAIDQCCRLRPGRYSIT